MNNKILYKKMIINEFHSYWINVPNGLCKYVTQEGILCSMCNAVRYSQPEG